MDYASFIMGLTEVNAPGTQEVEMSELDFSTSANSSVAGSPAPPALEVGETSGNIELAHFGFSQETVPPPPHPPLS